MKIKITIPPFKLSETDKQIIEAVRGTDIEQLVQESYDRRLKQTESKVIDLPCDGCGSSEFEKDERGAIFQIRCSVCGELR